MTSSAKLLAERDSQGLVLDRAEHLPTIYVETC